MSIQRKNTSSYSIQASPGPPLAGDTSLVKNGNRAYTYDEASRNYTATMSGKDHSKVRTQTIELDIYAFKLKILIYASYCLMTTCEGAFEPIGGSLYNNFESQLNASSSDIAYILSVKPICSAVAAIVTAAMLDNFENSHKYICIISIISAVTLSLMVYITNIYLMYIAFGVIGYYIGAVFVSYPVYIFRLFPNHQNRALFFCMCIYGVSKTVMPLLIDLSLLLFNSYGEALSVISFLLIIVSILMGCLPTPKHDPLRSAKMTMTHTNSTDNNGTEEYKEMDIQDIEVISQVVSTNKTATIYANFSFVLLILMMFAFSSYQSGTVNFIQTFVTKHLGKKESIARYLISSYYGGQLLYRILVTILFKEVNPILSMCVSSTCLIIMGTLFVGFGNVSFIKDSDIWLLYVMYVSIGFLASSVFPSVYKWGELIKTVSGFLSGLFVVAFSLGDAGMVAFVGTLVNKYGAIIIPYPIAGYIAASFCFTFVGVCVYWRYCAIKNKIIDAM